MAYSRIIGGLVAVLALAAASVAFAGLPINCTGGPCQGTPDNDAINGSNLADQIKGLAGNDEIAGNGANDQIAGGAGRDESFGGKGNDRHRGGKGNDYLSEFGVGTGGQDTLLGGPGSDFLEANEEGDVLRAGAGNDRESVDSMPMRLRGGSSECYRGFCSTVFGDTGNDRVYGGKGADQIEGEEGRDELYGGAGDDVVDAANDDTGEVDKVFCGSGRDLAVVRPEDKVADDCERTRPPKPADTGPPRGHRNR